MLAEALRCRVTGLTISPKQAWYCQVRGVHAEIMDIEQRLPDDSYDIAFCLEAMEHVVDKSGLLVRLRHRASHLLLSTGCIADPSQPSRKYFGDTISFCTPSELRNAVQAAGWSIRRMVDRRFQSLRTLFLWKKNLASLPATYRESGQLGILAKLVDEALADPIRWSRAFPLIDIIAD